MNIFPEIAMTIIVITIKMKGVYKVVNKDVDDNKDDKICHLSSHLLLTSLKH